MSVEVLELSTTVKSAYETFKKLFLEHIPDSKKKLDLIKTIESSSTIYAPLASHELEAFNAAYFLRNGLKALIALEQSSNNLSVSEVFDIGSGVGTATIAWRLLSNIEGVRFNLIDKSDRQIQLARKFMQAELFADDIVRLGNDVSSQNCEEALSILSYSVCEMSRGEILRVVANT